MGLLRCSLGAPSSVMTVLVWQRHSFRERREFIKNVFCWAGLSVAAVCSDGGPVALLPENTSLGDTKDPSSQILYHP